MYFKLMTLNGLWTDSYQQRVNLGRWQKNGGTESIITDQLVERLHNHRPAGGKAKELFVAIWIVHGLQRVMTSPHLIKGSVAWI